MDDMRPAGAFMMSLITLSGYAAVKLTAMAPP